MSQHLSLDRRRFLTYVGAGAAAIFAPPWLASAQTAASAAQRPWVDVDGNPLWAPRRHPIPLPTDPPDQDDARQLARFEVRDDLLLPEGFEYRVVAQWGDVFGPAGQPQHQVQFGYDNDFTGLLPIPGQPDHFWLFVNHEYIAARPWLQAWREVYGEDPPLLRIERHPNLEKGRFTFEDVIFDTNELDVRDPATLGKLPAATLQRMRLLATRILSAVGVSILRVRRTTNGGFEVERDARDHKRISAIDRQNVAGQPADHSFFTGPAAWLHTEPPAGTMSNCSGGVSPWGTFFTCEENIFLDVLEDIDPHGRPLATKSRGFGALPEKSNEKYLFDQPTPPTLIGNGHILEKPLDGRQYGWVCEVDPADGYLYKHTALGRFRHENVALRTDRDRPLAAYMGDDRRGGHVWKYVSNELVRNPSDPAQRRLLESGTLYVARFNEDGSGEWIPLRPETPLRRPEPELCFSAHCQVPARTANGGGGGIAVGDPARKKAKITVDQWVAQIEAFTGKAFAQCTLGDLVRVDATGLSASELAARQLGILLTDAFLMANACGGTPTARPEDLEVHPFDRTVYIAFTEASDSSDGSPDARIFPDSARGNSRQYGAIYRLLEGGVEGTTSDPGSTSFTWGKFVSSGEVAEQGGGFAFADNLVFDLRGHLWMVTDITTTAQNAEITHHDEAAGTQPGGANYAGIFGNNAMFFLPTYGPNAHRPYLFATGPMDCELCGPTFSPDGEALLLSIQHPGELDGARRADKPDQNREMLLHDRHHQPFRQTRRVPVGSNFPHGELGRAPRPCVVCITRKT